MTTLFFFFFFFFCPQAYFADGKWLISKKTIIFQGSREGPTFFRGVGESYCLFPRDTHITCDFPGGGVRNPCPPLDPHLVDVDIKLQKQTKKIDLKKIYVR